MKKIKEINEVIKEPILSTYSIMLLPWEEVLGYEFCNNECDVFDAAAVILYELTFFGYDYNTSMRNMCDFKKELECAEKEVLDNDSVLVEWDEKEFRKIFDLPEKTKQEKIVLDKLQNNIMVKNYNINVDIYNMIRNC